MKRTGLNSILQATRSENAALQHSIVENLRLVMLNFIADTLEQEVMDELFEALEAELVLAFR